MVSKKRVILTFVPTDKNLMILQNMGFINRHGRSTGRKNLGEFINRCIDDKIGIDNSSQNGELLERILLLNIQTLQKQRDQFNKEIEDQLKAEAQKLSEHRSQQKLEVYVQNEG